MIRHLEEFALNAWPALRTLFLDGWLLRFADGFQSENNCAQLYAPGRRGLRQQLALCHAVYAAQGFPLRVRVAPLPEQDALAAALPEVGLRVESECCVYRLSGQTTGAPAPIDTELELSEGPPGDWVQAALDCDFISAAERAALAGIVQRISTRRALLVLRQAGAPALVALAVLQQGGAFIPVFWCRPAQRRIGLGSVALHNLRRWATEHGANEFFLRAPALEAGAKAFVSAAGGKEVYRYRLFRSTSS